MRLPWRKKARLIEPRPMVGLNVLELQTAKEILAEVFHARPADVEEMIQRRLEKKNSPVEYEDVLWPSTFCLVD
jgi:ribose 1,5-bisphosphokinase PhnN